jgi:hypothetical protein
MSFQLSPTNRSQIVTTGDRFVVAVAGDFRGGQLHVQFSIAGVFASQGNEGIHIFETAGLRSFESNGEDIKLLWVGEAGAVNVSVTNLSATGLAFTEILGLPTASYEHTSLADVGDIILTPTCGRVSIVATGSDIRYEVYNTNDGPVIEYLIFAHLILQNERIDIRVNPNSAIRFLSLTEGTLHVSELA